MEKKAKEELIISLFQSNCIELGNFRLKNGDVSKYYFNMKNIISYPNIIKIIGDEIYKNLEDFDIICGIPYGGLPVATYISVEYNKPMIILRDKAKNYGMGKLIEGEYKKESRCVIIDDVITTGGSIEDTIDKLKTQVNIVNIAVIFDRQQNYKCSMPIFSLLNKNDVTRYKINKIINNNKLLCLAADINDPNKLLDLLNNVGDKIGICKIHYDCIDIHLCDDFINKLISLSIKHDFLIMEDRKFVDISSIVEKQYNFFKNWVDLITVHGSVTNEVIEKLSGALIVANMSNNDYNLNDKSTELAKNNYNNVIGFISQNKINCLDLITMTPGISLTTNKEDDQKYRTIKDVKTDIYIVGRGIYISRNPTITCNEYLSNIKNFKNKC